MDNVNQQINKDLIPFSINLMQIEEDIALKLLNEFKKLEKELINELLQIDLGEKRSTRFKEARLQELLKQTRKSIKSYYDDALVYTNDELVSIAQLTDKTIRGIVNTNIGANIMTTGISQEMATAIVNDTAIAGVYQVEYFKKMGDDVERNFKSVIRQGMLKGEPMAEIVRRVKGEAGYPDNMSKKAKSALRANVRSSVMNISNTAREEVYKNNKKIMKGITWVSTLDNRTTLICQGLDGLSWTMEYKPIGHDKKYVGVTAHFGCRSTQVPMIKSYENLPKKIRDQIPMQQRSSINGDTPVTIKYEEFLKGESEAFQLKVLGATRRRLWREGKITFTDLIDQKWNPVSVKDLLRKFDA